GARARRAVGRDEARDAWRRLPVHPGRRRLSGRAVAGRRGRAAADRGGAAQPRAPARSRAGRRRRLPGAGRSERRPPHPALQNLMRVRIFATPLAASRALARFIARGLAADPRLVLGLPTGRTPVPLYRELAALRRRGLVDFSRASTFNLDEFVGVARDDPSSYRAFMQRHLFDHLNLAAN